jgi:hypothetical protein
VKGDLSICAAKLKPRDGSLAKSWPLEAKRRLLSERERALYQRLVQSLPNHIVRAQVHLLQVLDFQRGRRNVGILNRISQLSVTQPRRTLTSAEFSQLEHVPPETERASTIVVK